MCRLEHSSGFIIYTSLSAAWKKPSGPCRLLGCRREAKAVDGLLYHFDFCHQQHKTYFGRQLLTYYNECLLYVALLAIDDDFCLYPGCNEEKEYFGAQFCSEEHLDKARDEGKITSVMASLYSVKLPYNNRQQDLLDYTCS